MGIKKHAKKTADLTELIPIPQTPFVLLAVCHQIKQNSLLLKVFNYLYSQLESISIYDWYFLHDIVRNLCITSDSNEFANMWADISANLISRLRKRYKNDEVK